MTQQQNDLELKNTDSPDQAPVTCLGMTFKNDDARRAHFTQELRKKLKDPEFRKIEGFPIGEDEDILALSDPPYYTACPNPWIADFIEEWEAQKPEKPDDFQYQREPFAADVSEGRSGLFYDAHSYHTKVPHKAIMRYILHYTNPGDIIFDGFCGTGMTGVAAQLCEDRLTLQSMGFKIDQDGRPMQSVSGPDGNSIWQPHSNIGARHAIIADLSPAATFIAYNYNSKIDVHAFETAAHNLIEQATDGLGWMYETRHSDGRTGIINYTIWSDVFICPNCSEELTFWSVAVDLKKGAIRKEIPCPHCGVQFQKNNAQRAQETYLLDSHSAPRKRAKQAPVLINYSVDGKRFEKVPDAFDLAMTQRIISEPICDLIPDIEIPEGFNTRQPRKSHGVQKVAEFYTRRNLLILARLRSKLGNDRIGQALKFLINSYDLSHSTLMTRLIFKSAGKKPVLTGYQSGTLYISSLPVEKNIFQGLAKQKLPIIQKSLSSILRDQLTSTASATATQLPDACIDYIFVDPPFGANIMYSELNFLSEAWAKVYTNSVPEAIENSVSGKKLEDYRHLMTCCFREAYRILKSGRWMTVEFSNTKASVWNSIQVALTEAGFITANVSALDKKQGSFKAVTTPTAVKQDLVISVYKPDAAFDQLIDRHLTEPEGVWDFVGAHLGYLPVTRYSDNVLELIPERDPRILFDQVISYFVRKGFPVPISSHEFQRGLNENFIERDGMYFLPEQALEYEKAKLTSGSLFQPSLFVSDEASILEWLRRSLAEMPQTFSELNPKFMQKLKGWSKNEIRLDLRELLSQNFLCYEGNSDVPDQIHSYLSRNWKTLRKLPADDPDLVAKAMSRWYVPDPTKAADLQALRERGLLREFESYKKSKNMLKVFRLEAIRVGLRKEWQNRNYAEIIKLVERMPKRVLEEDTKITLWYDQALTRLDESSSSRTGRIAK